MGNTARDIAAERSFRNRRDPRHRGVLNDPDRIDQDGVLGEIAVAKDLGVSLDAIRREGRQPYNFRLKDGTRVDVRASRHENARLIVPPNVAQRTTIDVFVLVQIERVDNEWVGRPVGWMSRREVKEAGVVKISDRPGATPVHLIPPYKLRPMEEPRRRNQMLTKTLPGL